MKNSFILYSDQREIFKRLSQRQCKELIFKIFDYSDGIESNSNKDPVVEMAFTAIKMALDRDQKRYDEKCKKNKENIQKRWNKIDTTVYDGIRLNDSYTKHTDSDSGKASVLAKK